MIKETEKKELVWFVEEHLKKIEDELKKFESLTEDININDGPSYDNWEKTENIAHRLHNFYMGVEHIFKRVAKILDDDGVPGDKNWHKQLLKQMGKKQRNRPAVINKELRRELLEYLEFRHVWRGGYSMDLDWERMKELVKKFKRINTEMNLKFKKLISSIND